MPSNALWELTGAPKTFILGETVPQYSLVTFEADGKLDAADAIGDESIGVTMEAGVLDDAVPVATTPGDKVVLLDDGNAAIAVGADLMASPSVPGSVRLAAGTGARVIGKALAATGGTAGEAVQAIFYGTQGDVLP